METIDFTPYAQEGYIIAQILLTYIVLKFKSKTTSRQKLVTSIVVGALLGVVWFVFMESPLEVLIIGWFASAAFYDYLISLILKKFKK